MRCSSCGAEAPENARFCGSCGTSLARKAFCINCGAALATGDSFCGECGAGQKAASARPALEPVAPAVAAPSQKGQPAGKRGGAPRAGLLLGAAAVPILAAGAFFFLQGRGSAPATPTPAPPIQAASTQQPISFAEKTPQATAVPVRPTAAPTRVPTQIPSPTRPQVTATSTTAPAQVTATAQVAAAATAQAQIVAQATATAQAAFSAANELAKNTTRVKGVLRGNLEPRPDGRPASQGWGVNMRDFVVEGRFFNPHDRTERAWDYGILFRAVDERDGYRVSVHSDTEWYLELATREGGQTKVTTLAWGHTPNMDLAANGSNVLRLVVGERAAYLFVNGAFVTTLDVSMWTGTGDVAVVSGLFPQHTIPGKVTRFEGFDLFSLE